MKKAIALMLCLGAGFANASGYTQTKYPLVLAPGVLGFDKIFGVEYWYHIPSALSGQGARVYTTTASASNDSITRGEQLLSQVNTILAVTGAQKVNLIGHSHGGVASRYVAAVAPTKVASVTTIGSPHKGTPVADDVQQILSGTAGSVVLSIINGAAKLLDALAGTNYMENTYGELASMSTSGAAAFNAQFPNGVPGSSCGNGASSSNGQLYYSWGGTSTFTNVLDPLDYFFSATGVAFNGAPNDGLTGQCSSHFGTVLRDNYPWNHGDEINQVFGIRGLFTPDPVQALSDQANRLKNAGV
jgi:triacylglycerol lipase